MPTTLPLNQILIGDCRELLKTLPDGSVHCVVTSPPYWGLRSYQTDPQVWTNGHEPCQEHQWGDERITATGRNDSGEQRPNFHGQVSGYGGERKVSQGNTCSICGAWRGELGLEPTPELYVEHLTQIFREVRRVLRDDGTLWLNLGDSYAARIRQTKPETAGQLTRGNKGTLIDYTRPLPYGLKEKDLVGIPWMVAFALRADGYYLRSDIIWAKPNPMPESVTDRPTKAHEYIFLLSKSQRYYYDAESVKEKVVESTRRAKTFRRGRYINNETFDNNAGLCDKPIESDADPSADGRNRRTVWTVATHPFKGAHFATFPPKLIEPCILAGCPVGGVVLDPFMGSGTTASVCISLKRHYIGFDLNPAYVEDLAQDRADTTPPPLFVI